MPRLLNLLLCLCLATLLAVTTARADAPKVKKARKRARPTEVEPGGKATPVEAMKLLPGFRVELLYTVPGQEQGSWVSLTNDNKGRLIASDQYGKLYRIVPPAMGSDDEIKVEPLSVDIGMAQGLLYAFDSLYVMVNDKEKSGLYRVRDTDGDDQFDDVKLLRKIDGSGEHGPHAVVLGPDGKSLYIVSGNHTKIPNPEKSLLPRNWQEDQLLQRMWDAGGHAVGILAPGGWICRVDPEGTEFEMVCGGFRNAYDIAFAPNGELFAYDSDMEWDVGTPWYRPTRVNHVVSGAEFGWRSGTGKWPAYYPDSLGSVVDIGPGSPTGVTFGTGAKFPAKYQQALFLCDWSYGTIYALHLTPQGASYTGEAERFIAAAPLPVTDIIVNPADGAMYFTIGGRRTQSALYRVTYTGPDSTAPADFPNDKNRGVRNLRHELEALHHPAPEAVEKAWPYLAHEDRHIRYAARIAVEHQPVESWQDRALNEQRPEALILAIIALARNGDASLQPRMIDALVKLDWSALSEQQQLSLLRAYGLTFARMGHPSDDSRQKVLDRLDAKYPAKTYHLNRELSRVLIYLEAPRVVRRTLDLMAKAPTQEEQLHYALSLRNLKTGWTLEDRQEYFQWFNKASGHHGGHSFSGFLANIRKEAIETLTDEEQAALKPLLDAKPSAEAVVQTPPRGFVRKWTVRELLPKADAALSGRNFEQGRQVFAAASCFKCHRFVGEGGITGPDLTAVGRRFNSQNLLESLIEPSKVISDQYEATMFLLTNGKTVVGRVVNLNGPNIMVSENLLDPGKLTPVDRKEIDEMQPSRTSLMPEGLLDTFTEDEILDLVAYLRSGGNPDDPAFAK